MSEEDYDEYLEDAAGSLDDDSEGSSDSGDLEAHPERPQENPILRISNRPQTLIYVPDEDRETDSRLHKTEAAHIIAQRAQQIAKSGTHFALDVAGVHDPVVIAYRELFQRQCPLLLQREVGRDPATGASIVEIWKVREMALPAIPPPRSGH